MSWDTEWPFEGMGWPFSSGQGSKTGRTGPRRGGGRGRGRRWKWFGRGDIKFAILALVAEKPMHGYEVMQALEEQSKGCYKASAGSIYPTLQLLEDQGFLKSNEQEGKKVYTATDAGKAFLEENRSQVDDIFARAEQFSERVFGHGMADLSRTFARFSQSTFQGAVGWLDDDELLGDLKKILNDAARDMEAAWESASSRKGSSSERGKPEESEPTSETRTENDDSNIGGP